jgi:uncharacterized protein (TIGR00369 family)
VAQRSEPHDAVTDGQTADGPAADGHATDEHATDGHATDEHLATPERRRSYAWQDPAVAAAAAPTMAGIDFFRAIADGTLPAAPIAQTLGFTVTDVEPGRVVFEITPAEFHYNPIGSVHGGVYATLCDSACGCAIHSMLPAGAGYTSQDLSVKFLRAITTSTGRLRCEGTVIHLGSRTGLAQARLTDGQGKLYAYATSSCLIFRP